MGGGGIRKKGRADSKSRIWEQTENWNNIALCDSMAAGDTGTDIAVMSIVKMKLFRYSEICLGISLNTEMMLC